MIYMIYAVLHHLTVYSRVQSREVEQPRNMHAVHGVSMRAGTWTY